MLENRHFRYQMNGLHYFAMFCGDERYFHFVYDLFFCLLFWIEFHHPALCFY